MFKPIETTGIRPRTPRSKTPTTPGAAALPRVPSVPGVAALQRLPEVPGAAVPGPGLVEPAFPGAAIRVPARRIQQVNPAYNRDIDSLSNQTVQNLLRHGRMTNFNPVNLGIDSSLASEFYQFYNKPQPEPDGYMGANYNPRDATFEEFNNWFINVKNQMPDEKRAQGIYSIYKDIMKRSPAIPAQPFGPVNENYSDNSGRNSRQGYLNLLEDTARLNFVPPRQQASSVKSGIAEFFRQISVQQGNILPSIFTINDTKFISNDILNVNTSQVKKLFMDFICDSDIIDSKYIEENILQQITPDNNPQIFVLDPSKFDGQEPLSIKSEIKEAVDLYNSDKNPPSVNQIPIFIVLEIGLGFHTAVLLKINEKVYSFGYGFSSTDIINKKPVAMAVVNKFDLHTGNGGIYSPDFLIDYDDPSYRNRIIDIGILKPYHIEKIEEYLSYIEGIRSEITFSNNNSDLELKGNVLFGSRLPKYNTTSSKIGNALGSIVGKEKQLNCASFISSIFPSAKTGLFISMPNSAVGRADDEKIEEFQRLYLQNDIDKIKELLCDECCGIDCSKCGEPISEGLDTCKQCCYSQAMSGLKNIERSRNPILKNTGLSCLAGKCRENYEPSDTRDMYEPIIGETLGQYMDRGGKLKTKRIRYTSRKSRKIRKLKTKKLKPRKSRKLRNKNTRKYI